MSSADRKAAAAAARAATPKRYPELRRDIIILHVLLAASLGIFVHLSYKDNFVVPEGQYRVRDSGKFIPIEDYDPIKFGPYPRCHEHHKEHKDHKEELVNLDGMDLKDQQGLKDYLEHKD